MIIFSLKNRIYRRKHILNYFLFLVLLCYFFIAICFLRFEKYISIIDHFCTP